MNTPILVIIAIVAAIAIAVAIYFTFRTEKFTQHSISLTRDYTPRIGKFHTELQGTMEQFGSPIGALRNDREKYPLFSSKQGMFTIVDNKQVSIAGVETGDIIHVPGAGTLQVTLF